MVNIEIDGKKIQAREGCMVIEAADDAGIYIPRFCYHKKLSIAANCRMCLVEVEKAPKALPACATPVTEGMKVFTSSPKAVAAQKGVMEFLLINHPLDCPICDQGGECELQDIAVGYGSDVSQYTENKRVLPQKDFGPLVTGDMTRCIHCTRCVRFCEEIAGVYEMGATGRGEHTEIGTYVKHSLRSELSGNIIDLCPVGALTSKPFRFSVRAWELLQRSSVAPHDCIGSNIFVHVHHDKVRRVVPRDNEELNETWLSDRDRFSYEGLDSPERLRQPMIKVDGSWQETDWATALHRVVAGVRAVAPESLGALVSPISTLEELYLLQKLMRGLGSANIDHRLAQRDFSDQDLAPLFPWLGQALHDLEDSDAVLLVGSDIRRDQPIAGHRLRKAGLRGAKIAAVNPQDYDFNFPLEAACTEAGMQPDLAAIAKVLVERSGKAAPAGFSELTASVKPDESHEKIASALQTAESASVLIGLAAMNDGNFAALRSLAGLISELTGARLGYLPHGGNGAGAWLAGAVPHREVGGKAAANPGRNVAQMVDGSLQAFLLLNVEAECDCGSHREQILANLAKAGFVASLTPFVTDTMRDYADVLLPVSPFTETAGSFINVEGRLQSIEGVVAPLGESRPAWKVLRVLGNLFELPGFEQNNAEEIRNEWLAAAGDLQPDNKTSWQCPESLAAVPAELGPTPYAGDGIVRRADSLQAVGNARV